MFINKYGTFTDYILHSSYNLWQFSIKHIHTYSVDILNYHNWQHSWNLINKKKHISSHGIPYKIESEMSETCSDRKLYKVLK